MYNHNKRWLVFTGMKKFEYEGRKWHEECFQCDECHQPIRDQKFAPDNDRIICVHCYEQAYAPRCHNCKGVSFCSRIFLKLTKPTLCMILISKLKSVAVKKRPSKPRETSVYSMNSDLSRFKQSVVSAVWLYTPHFHTGIG